MCFSLVHDSFLLYIYHVAQPWCVIRTYVLTTLWRTSCGVNYLIMRKQLLRTMSRDKAKSVCTDKFIHRFEVLALRTTYCIFLISRSSTLHIGYKCPFRAGYVICITKCRLQNHLHLPPMIPRNKAGIFYKLLVLACVSRACATNSAPAIDISYTARPRQKAYS